MALDPTIPVWPRCLSPRSVQISLASGSLTGPQPLAGAPQTAQSAIGRLELRLSNVMLRDAQPLLGPIGAASDKLRNFRALYFGRLAHGLPVYMPLFDWRRGPRARAGLPLFGPATLHSDGTPFSDLSEYGQGSGDAILAVAASALDREITIDALTVAVPTAGDFVGLGDRAHMVTGAWPDEATAGRWRLRIAPPVRQALAVGEPVEVADPVCLMRLSEGDRASGVDMDLNRVGYVSFTFTEANWTP